MKTISKFRREYYFLSNFFFVSVIFDGEIYPSVEHAYMAAKTTDKISRKEIKDAKTPGEAKRLGKLVKLRENWDEIKLEVMESLLLQKFGDENPKLKRRLLETQDALLMEGNNWGDTFWGVCNGEGENNLGKLLMKIRG